MERDVDFFNNLTTQQGVEATLRNLEEITKNIDLSTQYGREISLAKEEILTRIAYQNRSVEE